MQIFKKKKTFILDMLNNLKLPSPAKKSENVDEPATQEAETNSSNSGKFLCCSKTLLVCKENEIWFFF